MEPLVSIITPALIDSPERAKWLGELTTNLIDQTMVEWEWIVIDDASPMPLDLPGDSRIRVMRAPNPSGPAGCRNTAAALARATILPLDADDLLADNDTLAFLYSAWNDHKRRFVYGDIQAILEDGQRKDITPLPPYSMKNSLNTRGTVPVTAMHARDAWLAAGGWKPQLEHGLEDVEYWIAMGRAGWCGLKLDRVTLLYRRHSDSRFYTMRRNGMETSMIAQIRLMHEDLYKGEMPVGCCGGSRSSRSGAAASRPLPVRNKIIDLEDNPTIGGGKIWVRYEGSSAGGFGVIGDVTKTPYRIEGQGCIFAIWAVDAPKFQRYGRGTHFTVGVPAPQVAEPEPEPEPEAPPADPPQLATIERIDAIGQRKFSQPEPETQPEPPPVVEMTPPPLVEGEGPSLEDMNPDIPGWDRLAAMLAAEQQTVQGLSVIDPYDLMLYQGIGPAYAERIIKEARRLCQLP